MAASLSAVQLKVDAARHSLAALTLQRQSGKLSEKTWLDKMTRVVTKLHAQMAAMARSGGGARVTDADRARVADYLDTQLRYLNRYAAQVKKREKPLSVARSMLYGSAGRGAYFHALVALAREKSSGEVRRVLNDEVEHCVGCVREARRGWMPVADLKPIGSLDCRVHCKCTLKFR